MMKDITIAALVNTWIPPATVDSLDKVVVLNTPSKIAIIKDGIEEINQDNRLSSLVCSETISLKSKVFAQRLVEYANKLNTYPNICTVLPIQALSNTLFK